MKIRASIVVLILIIASCGKSSVDDCNEDVDLKVVRYEQALFNADMYSLSDSLEILKNKYPHFSILFSGKIIEIGDTATDFYYDALSSFITDVNIYSFYRRVEEKFPDFSSYKAELGQAFCRYKSAFPEKEVPDVYTFISGLNQSVVAADGILGVSLDKYLGSNEKLYDKVYPPIPQYLRRNMQPEYIVSDLVKSWVISELDYKPVKDDFISQMINEAKGMYIAKQLMPQIADSLLWGFTGSQLQFCVGSEQQMWAYLIEQKLLFSTDYQRISKFIEPGPFTKDFTNDSPARAAVWIGYQLVDQFMSRQKDMTLSELSEIQDYHRILNEARYNP